ncbi:MAG: serine/threonine-protein kinase, partial [Pirellula sp.]
MIAEQQKCLDAATLADLLAGRMPTDRFAGALEHIEACERCTQAAERNSNHAKMPWIDQLSDSSPERKFDMEQECSAVVGNLLIQASQSDGCRSASNAAVLLPRETLGPYRLISSLGSGGMGTVYLAEHQRLKRQVAIKLLPRDKLARTGWLDRFNREMTAIAALEHPNVVRALDAGDEEQWHYLVMEYQDGLDLNRVAHRIPDISVRAACEIIRQGALGLSAIHQAGMIHRDIKPSNLFLTRNGTVKILDLGLVLDGESPLLADERLTTVGHLMGTLPFMAREQLDDARNVDWRTDIYSLGATLCKLLTGRPPYGSADHLARTVQAISTTEAPTIASRRSDLPADLIGIVDRMLSSNVATRPQSALEVAELLQPFCAESGPKELIRSAMQSNDDLALTPFVAPFTAPATNLPPHSRWPWWIAAALVPFAFAAGIFVTIATDRGTLVLETDEPMAAVKVFQGDKVVEQLEITHSQPSMLELRSGKYVVEVTGIDSDRMEVKNNQVILSRGDRQVAKVVRKDPQQLAESLKQSSESAQSAASSPTLAAKTFQDKSLDEWTEVLKRERSAETLALAMEGVSSLVDAPDEKWTAARYFLQASRRLGGNSSIERGSGGRGTIGRGSGGRGSSSANSIPVAPRPLSSTEVFMNALEGYFPRVCSGLPDAGLAAIADELENGTNQSKTACLCLLSPFLSYQGKAMDTFLFDEMSKVDGSQNLLKRLDKLVENTLHEMVLSPETKKKAFRVRISISKSLGRDLKLDPQFVKWAMDNLTTAKESTTTGAVMDAFSASTTYRLLEGSDLDLSPLIIGLARQANDITVSELESAMVDLCRRHPVECALVSEFYVKRGYFTSGVVMENLGTHHPRPFDAILSLIKFPNRSPDEMRSIHQALLVRVVLEIDLVNDPTADAKLAFAAHAFALMEIPSENSQRVMSIFFERLRNFEPSKNRPGFPSSDSWPSPEAVTYNAATKNSLWTLDGMHYHLSKCISRSPSGAIPAIADELRQGNDKSAAHCTGLIMSSLTDALTSLTTNERRVFSVPDDVGKTLLSYMQTDA